MNKLANHSSYFLYQEKWKTDGSLFSISIFFKKIQTFFLSLFF
jgi:hypothetical protein